MLLLLEVVEDDVDEDDRRLLGHWEEEEEEESIREKECEEEEKEAVSEISRNDADADVDDEKRVSGRGILAWGSALIASMISVVIRPKVSSTSPSMRSRS